MMPLRKKIAVATLLAGALSVPLTRAADAPDDDAPREAAAPERSFMHGAAVTAVALSPDGKVLATCGGFKATGVRLWDVATGRELRCFAEHGGGISAAAFSPDGQQLATAGWDGEAQLWEVATGKRVRVLRTGKAGICGLSYAANGRLLALSTAAAVIYLHDPATGREVRQLLFHKAPAQRETLTLCALSPDANTVVALVRGSEAEVCAWSLAQEKEVWRQVLTETVVGLVFAPDGRTLALETSWETVGLLEAASGQVRAWLGRKRGQSAPVIAPRVAFAPDGSALVSCVSGREIVFWNLPGGGRRSWQEPVGGFIQSVAFGSDGRSVVCGRHDGIAVLRDVPPPATAAPAKELSADALEAHWTDLASGDAARAYQAIQGLGVVPGQSVPFLAQRLQPPAVDPQRLAQLVADLDDDRFAVRQKAAAELERFGEVAAEPLRAALKAQPPLELGRRIENLLTIMARTGLTPARLRCLRGIEALEGTGAVEAMALLERLAAGAPGMKETEDARAAVARLKRRVRK